MSIVIPYFVTTRGAQLFASEKSSYSYCLKHEHEHEHELSKGSSD